MHIRTLTRTRPCAASLKNSELAGQSSFAAPHSFVRFENLAVQEDGRGVMDIISVSVQKVDDGPSVRFVGAGAPFQSQTGAP